MENADDRSIIKKWMGLTVFKHISFTFLCVWPIRMTADAVYMKPTSTVSGSRGCQAASWGMLWNHRGGKLPAREGALGARSKCLQAYCSSVKTEGHSALTVPFRSPPIPELKAVLTALHCDNSQQFQKHQEARMSKVYGFWMCITNIYYGVRGG